MQFVYSNPASGVVNPATSSLQVQASPPGGVYIQTGPGNDLINLGATTVGNLVDAGSGFNSIFGGTGNDDFQMYAAGPTVPPPFPPIVDQIFNWHPGDVLSMFGINPATLHLTLNGGNLKIDATTAGGPGLMSATIIGIGNSAATLTNIQVGTTANGTNYLNLS
jgi:hypothetical protein